MSAQDGRGREGGGRCIASFVVKTLVSVKAVRKSRRVFFVGYVGSRHTCAAAATGLRTVPRPVGMILAHPARAVANAGIPAPHAASRESFCRARPIKSPRPKRATL